MSELMQEGNYRGKLESAQFCEASTGTLQMALTFQLAQNGPRRTVFLAFTENTMGRDQDGKPRMSQRVLNDLGYNGDDPPTFANPTDNVELYMKHDTYQGTTSEKWSVSGGGMNITEASKDRVQKFQAQWRATGGGTKPPATSSKTSKPPASPPPAQSGGPPPAEDGGGADYAKFDASTKEEAWAIWCREGKASATDAVSWHKAVREVANGRAEGKLTADDWKAVAHKAMPF